MAVQWLGLCTSAAGGMGSIAGGGTKIPLCGCSEVWESGFTQKEPKTQRPCDRHTLRAGGARRNAGMREGNGK